jgi:hypothetical protein
MVMNKTIDLQAYRAELQQKIQAIDLLLGGYVGNGVRRITPSTKTKGGHGKRTMPAAARARLAAIARARWKKVKAAGKKAL